MRTLTCLVACIACNAVGRAKGDDLYPTVIGKVVKIGDDDTLTVVGRDKMVVCNDQIDNTIVSGDLKTCRINEKVALPVIAARNESGVQAPQAQRRPIVQRQISHCASTVWRQQIAEELKREGVVVVEAFIQQTPSVLIAHLFRDFGIRILSRLDCSMDQLNEIPVRLLPDRIVIAGANKH